jgi:hypothetical protein
LNGSNLLDDTHAEYALPTARLIRRSIYGEGAGHSEVQFGTWLTLDLGLTAFASATH